MSQNNPQTGGDNIGAEKPAQRRGKSSKTDDAGATELKPSTYQPSKAELEKDLSVPVSLERLAKAALSGGAERRKP